MSEAVDKAVEFLEREIDKSMAIEHAMANGRRYWLRLLAAARIRSYSAARTRFWG